MRHELYRQPLSISVERSNNFGAYQPYKASVKPAYPDSLERERSDVVKTPIVGEWRKPTPYFAMVRESALSRIWFDFAQATSGLPYSYRGHIDTHSDNTLDMPVIPAMTKRALRSSLPNGVRVSQAETRALNNLADRKGSFVESAAEARKTILGLASNATAISDFLFAAARKDLKGICKALSISPSSRRARKGFDTSRDAGATLGGFWLNFWFGLSPIVSDMVSATAYLSSEAALNRLRVHGKGVVKDTESNTYGIQRGLAPFLYINQEVKTEQTSFVYCSLWAGIDAPELRKLVVYGAVDVPQTLWAVQPLSFLVDWVIPVSEILRAHTATVGLTFKGGTLTRKFERTSVVPSTYSFSSPYYKLVSCDVSSSTETSLILQRTVYKGFPKPVLPWVKDPFDTWKAITSLALLSGWTKNTALK